MALETLFFVSLTGLGALLAGITVILANEINKLATKGGHEGFWGWLGVGIGALMMVLVASAVIYGVFPDKIPPLLFPLLTLSLCMIMAVLAWLTLRTMRDVVRLEEIEDLHRQNEESMNRMKSFARAIDHISQGDLEMDLPRITGAAEFELINRASERFLVSARAQRMMQEELESTSLDLDLPGDDLMPSRTDIERIVARHIGPAAPAWVAHLANDVGVKWHQVNRPDQQTFDDLVARMETAGPELLGAEQTRQLTFAIYALIGHQPDVELDPDPIGDPPPPPPGHT